MLHPSQPEIGRHPEAVLFDRDGTLVVDVPYNGDPDLMVAMPGARKLLDALRGAGVAVGVVTNQSAVGRGLITPAQLDAMQARLSELLGPFDVMLACPHRGEDGCACRKPRPGMVLEACRLLGRAPSHVGVVGDTGADVEAARRAGAWPILVPTPATRPCEVDAAPCVARDLAEAGRLLGVGAPRDIPSEEAAS